MAKKKNVYFIQVGFSFDKSVYLPYAVGAITAFCKNQQEINEKYDFPLFIYKREPLADALEKITEPYIAAFSDYVWNTEYNLALAKLIKEKYPKCIILFGGHSVAREYNENYLDVADILSFGDGEEVTAMLLREIDGGNLDNVPNIAYKRGEKLIFTREEKFFDVSKYPSPYLEGMFDDILKTEKDTELLSVIETNRGCPYSCAYCDWCNDKELRLFPMEKVKAELEWLSKNKIEYCFCADANFGLLPRDEEIATYLTTLNQKYGYPKVFRPCYAKNSDERVFNISRTLNDFGMDKGATLAFQTLSPKALEIIGRRNLDEQHFKKLLNMYAKAKIPTYSELILGLPGETKESFCDGMCRLLEMGQHNSLSVYYCELLPNSFMGKKAFIEKYGLDIIKVAFNHIHSADVNHEVAEYSYIVCATSDMSKADWVYSNLFSISVQCFHNLGLLRYFAMYLFKEKGVSYRSFYERLLDFLLKSDSFISERLSEFSLKLSDSLKGDWNYKNDLFGNVTWFFEEGLFLEIISKYDEFKGIIKAFLHELNIDSELYNDLVKYQDSAMNRPLVRECEIAVNYNLFEYFTAITENEYVPLEKKIETIIFENNNYFEDYPTYAKEVVWFGRRRGRTQLTNRLSLNNKKEDD